MPTDLRALSWASPRKLGAVLPQPAFFIGCMWIKITLTSKL